MAASTTERYDLQAAKVKYLILPVSNVKVLEGTLVAFNGTSGNIQQLADTAGLILAGMARQTVDNSAGAAGALSCEVESIDNIGNIILNAASPDNTWLGKQVYAVDDNTVALAATTTNDVLVGVVEQIVATGASGKVLVNLRRRTAA